jgi:hypothetical protein
MKHSLAAVYGLNIVAVLAFMAIVWFDALAYTLQAQSYVDLWFFLGVGFVSATTGYSIAVLLRRLWRRQRFGIFATVCASFCTSLSILWCINVLLTTQFTST